MVDATRTNLVVANHGSLVRGTMVHNYHLGLVAADQRVSTVWLTATSLGSCDGLSYYESLVAANQTLLSGLTTTCPDWRTSNQAVNNFH